MKRSNVVVLFLCDSMYSGDAFHTIDLVVITTDIEVKRGIQLGVPRNFLLWSFNNN